MVGLRLRRQLGRLLGRALRLVGRPTALSVIDLDRCRRLGVHRGLGTNAESCECESREHAGPDHCGLDSVSHRSILVSRSRKRLLTLGRFDGVVGSIESENFLKTIPAAKTLVPAKRTVEPIG